MDSLLCLASSCSLSHLPSLSVFLSLLSLISFTKLWSLSTFLSPFFSLGSHLWGGKGGVSSVHHHLSAPTVAGALCFLSQQENYLRMTVLPSKQGGGVAQWHASVFNLGQEEQGPDLHSCDCWPQGLFPGSCLCLYLTASFSTPQAAPAAAQAPAASKTKGHLQQTEGMGAGLGIWG